MNEVHGTIKRVKNNRESNSNSVFKFKRKSYNAFKNAIERYETPSIFLLDLS